MVKMIQLAPIPQVKGPEWGNSTSSDLPSRVAATGSVK
jgi:hypothetical protein